MLMREIQYPEKGQIENHAAVPTLGQWGCSYPAHIGYDDPTDTTPRLLGFSFQDRYRLSAPPLNSGYFDLGLRQITDKAQLGRYNFMSTRANNFSNRSEKGMMTVLPTADGQPVPPVDHQFGAIMTIPNLANVRYSTDIRQQNQQEVVIVDAGPSGWPQTGCA